MDSKDRDGCFALALWAVATFSVMAWAIYALLTP
jgi:hypothetical protein